MITIEQQGDLSGNHVTSKRAYKIVYYLDDLEPDPAQIQITSQTQEASIQTLILARKVFKFKLYKSSQSQIRAW